MRPVLIRMDMTVDDLLRHYLAASQVFIHFHTGCVGCPFGRFCTLADVAENYGLEFDELRRLLINPSPPAPPSNGEGSHFPSSSESVGIKWVITAVEIEKA